jgi:hypothetical protein
MKRFAIILAALAALTAPGCVGGIKDMCVKHAPTISQGTVLVTNAQTALIQAEAAIGRIADLTTREKALKALEDARKGLRVAEEMLHVASEACRAADVPAVIKILADAWKVVRPFLGTQGGSGAPAVQDPMAYTLALQE